MREIGDRDLGDTSREMDYGEGEEYKWGWRMGKEVGFEE